MILAAALDAPLYGLRLLQMDVHEPGKAAEILSVPVLISLASANTGTYSPQQSNAAFVMALF